MDMLVESLGHLLDPNWIMRNGGLYLVLLILFIETGIFLGFFLPGDPLLFVAGMVIASANEAHYPFETGWVNLGFWVFLFSVSTILGYFVGYWFGKKFGHVLATGKDSFFFKKKYLISAHAFYEKRGGFAVGIARFLPLVRTFAPIIGGMVAMDYTKFTYYNIVGAVIWVASITTLGFVLGDNPWVRQNLEYVIIGLVAIVTFPVVSKLVFSRKGKE
ncbi:MAG: VTT domain-containing protein [Flavobacteriales bacterium]|nr:VTT domain-containing protein [Flavobacteriales bacterium]